LSSATATYSLDALFESFSGGTDFSVLVVLISAGVVCSELPNKKVAEEYRSERSE
jgi:hypothetical protein